MFKPLPPSWHQRESADYLNQFSLFARNALTLNVDPVWPDGIHDRFYNSLSVGIPCITPLNRFTEHSCKGLSNFLYRNTNDIVDLSYNYLGLGDSERQKVSYDLQSFVAKNTWVERINTLEREIGKH